MNNNSLLVSKMVVFLYPLILIIGIYTIVFGHVSPGGGFQGGALLAAVFICRYLETPNEDIRLGFLIRFEKFLFLLIILLPCVFLFFKLLPVTPLTNVIYMISMNVLIGLKVCSGLTIIFYRFVFYEGGSKWSL